MAKGERARVGEPAVTPAERAKEDAIVTPAPQVVDATLDVAAHFARMDAADAHRHAVAKESAELVLGHGGLMASSYALAAAEHAKGADSNANARNSARRLLRLALAHLEA